MMALPFATIAGALVAALAGHRGWSLALMLMGFLLLAGLFALHATDPLDVQL